MPGFLPSRRRRFRCVLITLGLVRVQPQKGVPGRKYARNRVSCTTQDRRTKDVPPQRSACTLERSLNGLNALGTTRDTLSLSTYGTVSALLSRFSMPAILPVKFMHHTTHKHTMFSQNTATKQLYVACVPAECAASSLEKIESTARVLLWPSKVVQISSCRRERIECLRRH